MKRDRIPSRLLAAIIALIGVWMVMPSAANAHAMAGAARVHAERAADAKWAAAEAADCAGDVGSQSHGACCGASTFGCCAPCVLAPRELTTSSPVGAPIFPSALVEAPAGLPPGQLQKPPRLAR